ncbi:hypothetical protein AN219_37995 [Streptomyces nanshensis]|nr:hypothetical protein AN219_37995 [Streptomyces nanshensis]
MTPPRPGRDSGLVRPYVVTGGRTRPSRNNFDHATLIICRPEISRVHLPPDQRRVTEQCLPGALSVAEIAAHAGLPVSALRVLLADLMDSGHITSRAPIPDAQKLTDRDVLEAVLDGLRKL